MTFVPRDISTSLPDGRKLRLIQEEVFDPWTAWVADAPEVRESGRWLVSVLKRLLDTGPGVVPDYVMEIVENVHAVDTPLGRRFRCRCCDLSTLTRLDIDEMCKVCGWEDSVGQYIDVDYSGGPNPVTLRDARRLYSQRGYCNERAKLAGRLRPPAPFELPG